MDSLNESFLIDTTDHTAMFRVVAIALVAMAAFDLLFLNGEHVYAVEAVTLYLVHSIIG